VQQRALPIPRMTLSVLLIILYILLLLLNIDKKKTAPHKRAFSLCSQSEYYDELIISLVPQRDLQERKEEGDAKSRKCMHSQFGSLYGLGYSAEKFNPNKCYF